MIKTTQIELVNKASPVEDKVYNSQIMNKSVNEEASGNSNEDAYDDIFSNNTDSIPSGYTFSNPIANWFLEYYKGMTKFF